MNSFLISTNHAKGPGFGMFSATHLIVLVILALLTAIIIRTYRNSSENQRFGIRRTIAVLVVALEIIKDLLLMLTHQFTNANWPFELCGMAIFMIAVDTIHSSKATRELLYSLALPGALMAEITPNWVNNSIINIFVWQSFLIHALIVAYVLMRLISGEIVPSLRNLWRSAVFLIIVVPMNIWLNSVWKTNFMFLDTPSPGSPLEPLGKIFGPLYLLGFAGLLLVFWLIMYAPWEIWRIQKNKKGL